MDLFQPLSPLKTRLTSAETRQRCVRSFVAGVGERAKIEEIRGRTDGEPGMSKEDGIVQWLLDGDVSIQYQVHRDLLSSDRATQLKLRKRIEKEGWGAKFLDARQESGHWGRGFYQPKWTSTHYTLLDLKNLGLPRDNKETQSSVGMIFNEAMGNDGGIHYARTPGWERSDACVDGMVLNLASYFEPARPQLSRIVNLLLSVQMHDGGWNCEYVHGATHSSLHTTVSVLEGLLEYRKTRAGHREEEVKQAEKEGREFILKHQLFKSHRTGQTINKKMLMLSYQTRRWHEQMRIVR